MAGQRAEFDSVRMVCESDRTKREKLERDFPKLRHFQGKPVKLDIGGAVFKTSLETLTRNSESMLARMFSGRFTMQAQDDGSFFIDRDPTHFGYILNFLRTGEVIIPDDRVAREQLLLEVDFFNVLPMLDKLKELTEFAGSTLMKEDEKTTLLSWLNCARCSNWRLIYKARRDGFRAADFHRHCDNRGETVSVIHTTDGYLFGGYTDVPWTSTHASGEFKQSTRSFLFAFRSHGQGTKPVKLHVVCNSRAVHHDSSYCCTFGGGFNVLISDSSNTNSRSYSNWWSDEYYKLPPGIHCSPYWLVGQQNFQTQDIEVFGQ